MSVIVKGVNVPKNCYTCAKYRWSPLCPCWHGDAQASYYRTSRHPDCPIVEVPPHGRLIDADEMIRICDGATFVGSVKLLIDARPTVIEAEGSEE